MIPCFDAMSPLLPPSDPQLPPCLPSHLSPSPTWGSSKCLSNWQMATTNWGSGNLKASSWWALLPFTFLAAPISVSPHWTASPYIRSYFWQSKPHPSCLWQLPRWAQPGSSGHRWGCGGGKGLQAGPWTEMQRLMASPAHHDGDGGDTQGGDSTRYKGASWFKGYQGFGGSKVSWSFSVDEP